MFLGTQRMLPPADGDRAVGALAALGIISAALYATGLALGAELLARTSFWLLYAEEDRYRLLARNMTDVITRHGRNGAVLFVSPAAETLFGAKVGELHGHRPVRSRACRRSSRLSHGARRCRGARARRARSNSGCGAIRPIMTARRAADASQFIWVEMRCRRLERASGEATASPRWSR